MDENMKKHLLSTFDDIIKLMSTQGQKVVCSRLQEVKQLLREQPEIIRCKDCTYLNADTGICIVGIPHGYKDTFYCAYGEKAVRCE